MSAADVAQQPVTTWPGIIGQLVAGTDLSHDQARWAMAQVMAGEATPAQLAGFLVALRAKGESVGEVVAMVESMLAAARRIVVEGPAVDIVGTGGDRANTVNISTMAAITVAGTGVRVVKHGNRAASSASGTADVLEHLGVRLDLAPDDVVSIADATGITFCFAQVFHPSMRHAAVVRRELGVPTVFNILGPLANPAQPRAAAIGVADARLAPLVAGVLAARGTDALVFRGGDGLDELAATSTASVWWVRDRSVTTHEIDPAAELGLTPITVADLRGGDAAANAVVLRDVLAGTPGPIRETVLLNAAAALVADGSLPGTGEGDLLARLRAGMAHAAESLDTGAAARALEAWIAACDAAPVAGA